MFNFQVQPIILIEHNFNYFSLAYTFFCFILMRLKCFAWLESMLQQISSFALNISREFFDFTFNHCLLLFALSISSPTPPHHNHCCYFFIYIFGSKNTKMPSLTCNEWASKRFIISWQIVEWKNEKSFQEQH